MSFPWRYIVPRGQYIFALKVAKACPEIRAEVDKVALYTLLIYLAGAIALPFILMGLLASAIGFVFVWIWRASPDFVTLRGDTIKAMHAKVSVDEIRERVGLEPLRGTLLDMDGNPVGLTSVREV